MYMILQSTVVCEQLSAQSRENGECTYIQPLEAVSMLPNKDECSLTQDTTYGNPNPAPPHSIALTQSTVINGAPTKDPSVLVNITILKSCASECSSATSDDLTNDMVNTGRAEPRAYIMSARHISSYNPRITGTQERTYQ